jgi:hypothetical protein
MSMTIQARAILVAVALLPTLIGKGPATADPAPPAPVAQDERQRATTPHAAPNPFDETTTLITQPDKFSWLLFVHVNAKASSSPQSNDALWETWADDASTFPPSPNPADRPKWPGSAQPRTPAEFRKGLHLRSKVEGQALRRRLERTGKTQGARPAAPSALLTVNPNSDPQAGFITNVLEQVTRNRPAFDYLIKNNLWYVQGITDRVQPDQPPIDFPRDSLLIKAEWKILAKGEDKTRYHWNVDDKGTVYGLVGLHISSKAIPNWVWCTFEWVDNPGRSDYIGSRDAFGVKYPLNPNSRLSTPTFQAPEQQLGSIYPPGDITPQLEALFTASFGGDDAWVKQWKNYRLKGTQVDFTDSTGRPTLLGNTISENGFVATSSCMSCHARASVAVSGPGAGQSAFGGGFAPSVNNAGNVSYNGAPNPNWYFNPPGIAGGVLEGVPTNVQTDFLWGIPLLASPAPTLPTR